MNPEEFKNAIASLSFDNVFNPYSDRCGVYDLPDAPTLRSVLLARMLQAAQSAEIDSIWFGRDLGYRGGRRTGLALTDDIQFCNHANRWGVPVQRPTKGDVMIERTATVVWDILMKIDVPVFLWNIFPLHPYNPGNEFSNRTHSAKERRTGDELAVELIELLRPKRLVAIGNDAACALHHIAGNIKVIKVRHPSYGGQNQFRSQIADLYGIDDLEERPRLPGIDGGSNMPKGRDL